MEKLRVFTAFSGYDSQCLALNYLKEKHPDFDYELVGWSEIDRYAIQAHNALFPQWEDRNFGDISKIDPNTLPDFDLFTYSSPCQDFSNAGLRMGGAEGTNTRSSLLWYCSEIIRIKRPRFLLMENVKGLLSKKFYPTFRMWLERLTSFGYSNHSQVLNAKDYGIPQNRERIFVVSILGNGWYNFPKPMPLQHKLRDLLFEKVDEKYYLSDKTVQTFIEYTRRNREKGNGFAFQPTDGGGAMTLRADSGTRASGVFIYDDNRE